MSAGARDFESTSPRYLRLQSFWSADFSPTKPPLKAPWRRESLVMFTVYKHYSNVPSMKTKEIFVSTANRPLVGTSIGDVTRNIAILLHFSSSPAVEPY